MKHDHNTSKTSGKPGRVRGKMAQVERHAKSDLRGWRHDRLSLLVGNDYAAAAGRFGKQGDVTLLNVSYDPTRELYQD